MDVRTIRAHRELERRAWREKLEMEVYADGSGRWRNRLSDCAGWHPFGSVAEAQKVLDKWVGLWAAHGGIRVRREVRP